ncbi:hypothetical protein [Mucilaginibacter agri]|uniref:DUF4382 domain-containing protein n=1 Tax=Mucilaginibacter agri TaxID=2695265 RepID=A0A965ZED8_9SPHI|nr:hypothetical protein [Mucilaginibacter agri]NCD69185.1 hypothetical protein [Mucilaginibacter agri]
MIMKLNHFNTAFTLFIAGALLASCKKDNNNATPSGKAQLSFTVKADNPVAMLGAISGSSAFTNSVSTNASTSSVTWTSGVANVSSFKLEAKKNNTETEITSQNLTNIDLFAITPAAVSVVLENGTYTEIEVKANISKSSNSIPLVLKGNFTSAGGAVIPIELDFNEDATIKAETHDAVIVDGTNDFTNAISVHLSKLLNNVTSAELDAATRTSRTILISGSVNTGIYNKIKANFPSSTGSNGLEKHGKN